MELRFILTYICSTMPITYSDFLPSTPILKKRPSKLEYFVWTNKKAFKSWIQPNPNCECCGKVETMQSTLRMWILLRVTMEQAWGCPNMIPWHLSRRPQAQSGAGANNVIFNILHRHYYFTSKRTYPKYSATSNTRNQERYHLQTNVFTALC
jgi:hypothetical protein